LQARGLIGCWLLNEGAGTVVRDASGNGFHGTNSAATWTSGAFGPCMAFNGTDAFVDIPGKNMLYPLTMCCWVRLNVNNIVQVLLYLGDGVESGSATDLVCLRVNSEGTPLATAWRGSAGNSATGTTVLVPGVWYHLAAVFVHSTMREIYVNGVLEATNSNEEVIAGSKVYWSIGAWRLSAGGAQYHANALIDAPQFYNRALTPSEIASLYRDPYQMFRREPVEYYVTAGGEPEPPSAYTHIMIIAGTPALIVLTALAMAWQKRPPA
ncbi:MAG: LamG domain-containing protein, partial [Sphaerochaeta sp.]|nr:LamG domain-containing protein [Sphaerochaeta sp.]